MTPQPSCGVFIFSAEVGFVSLSFVEGPSLSLLEGSRRDRLQNAGVLVRFWFRGLGFSVLGF